MKLEDIINKFKFKIKNVLLAGATIIAVSALMQGCCKYTEKIKSIISIEDPTTPYSATALDADGARQYRFFMDNHHFLSLIDQEGTFDIRSHPGEDVNGWGSSWYAQPFLPGAVLGHTKIKSIVLKDEGVTINASGKVSYENSSTYGNWDINMTFNYDHNIKKVTGTGNYTITLDNQLNSNTGDLNLYKLASNYLTDVELVSGGFGNTGDMANATAIGDNFSYTWVPDVNNPGFFPGDNTDNLTVIVSNSYNQVKAFGVEPAQKPSMTVTLNSTIPETNMCFFAFYSTQYSKDFTADNVGITPLVLKSSTQTQYNFSVSFESEP